MFERYPIVAGLETSGSPKGSTIRRQMVATIVAKAAARAIKIRSRRPHDEFSGSLNVF
jgi:hypothetical protein